MLGCIEDTKRFSPGLIVAEFWSGVKCASSLEIHRLKDDEIAVSETL
jgi:hypothetical protein